MSYIYVDNIITRSAFMCNIYIFVHTIITKSIFMSTIYFFVDDIVAVDSMYIFVDNIDSSKQQVTHKYTS